VKQLTVPLLPDLNRSMPENYAQCIIPVTIKKLGHNIVLKEIQHFVD
jgi:hypothetical protein